MVKIEKSTERESRLVVASVGGNGTQEEKSLLMGTGFFFLADEEKLELDSGDDCTYFSYTKIK